MARSITDTPSIHVSGPRRTQGCDGFVALVVADIQSFWTASYPTIAGGQAYRDLKGGLLAGRTRARRAGLWRAPHRLPRGPGQRVLLPRRRASSPSTTPALPRSSSPASGAARSPRSWPTSGARHPAPPQPTRCRASSTELQGRTASAAPGWGTSAAAARATAAAQRHRSAPGHHGHPRVPRTTLAPRHRSRRRPRSAPDRLGSFQDGLEGRTEGV